MVASQDAPAGFVFNDAQSGFKSQLYRREQADGTFEYCYAFAGTEGFDADAGADVKQTAGMSDQYDLAIKNAGKLSAYLGNQVLTFTGHSLGGGLATAAALATHKSAVTFNPAWLSQATILKYNLNPGNDGFRVNNYIVAGEILNSSQTMLGPPMCSHVGKDHFMLDPEIFMTGNIVIGAGVGHTMTSVFRALNMNPPVSNVSGSLKQRAPAGALSKKP